MKASCASFIALRYLWGRGKEGSRYLRGAALGIALSLVPILVTLVVADGLIAGITDRYLELGTGHIQLFDRQWRFHDEETNQKIKNLPGVEFVWKERQTLALIIGKEGKTGTTVRAVENSFLEQESVRRYLTVIEGSGEFTAERSALLGEELARKTGSHPGDTIRIMTTRSSSTDGRIIPRLQVYTVAGIVSSGYRELDSLWCIVPYEPGSDMMIHDASRAFWGIKITNPFKDAGQLSIDIMSEMGSGFVSYTWQELQSSQYKSYQSTRQLLLFIMALVVLVAAVNVSSATSMLVVERRRDIAVLKASGATQRGIRSIFVMGAFWTGLVGALLGLSIGLLLATNINGIVHGLEAVSNFFISLFSGSGTARSVKFLDPAYYLENIPVIIDWKAVLLIALGTIVCSVLVAMVPAHRSGKLSPTDILRRY